MVCSHAWKRPSFQSACNSRLTVCFVADPAIKKAKANAGGESRAASATAWREAQATGRLLVHDAIERGRVEAKGRWLMNDAIEQGRKLAHGSAALPQEPVREDAESLRGGPQPEAAALSKHELSTAEYLASRAS